MSEANRLDRLRDQVKEFPQTPGVYLMKSRAEKIIYVGKAKNLRARVRSYFSGSSDLSPKTQFLVSHIETVDFILTKTEVEAFLLEASLIKKHRPRYNIRLRDDKAYPYIRISFTDNFPRLYLSRRVSKDGSLYFGPFSNGQTVHETIRFLNQTFQIRDCTDGFFKARTRPCLTHQIGRCTAPCVGLIESREYRSDVEGAVSFLRGRDQAVIRDLSLKMKLAAKEERFEAAARLRDSITAIKAVQERQKRFSHSKSIEGIDQDVMGYFGDERGTMIVTLHFRSGRLFGERTHFQPQITEADEPREWIVSFLNQYYDDNIVPDQVFVPMDLGRDLNKLLEALLLERKGSSAQVLFPIDAEGGQLLEQAERAALESFKEHVSKSEAKQSGLAEIQKRLGLPVLPSRIECFDISHFQGAETVASQVVFEDGAPAREFYRRYKIKTVEGSNDFASMREVISRRLKHKEYDDPQLIVIDGGKGQLNQAVEVLKELGREDLFVVGLAKARTQGEFRDTQVESTEERFFLPGRANPVLFPRNSEALRILVSIRDEAHRFAITYHRRLRESSSLESALDEIGGIGPDRKKKLLQVFLSVEALSQATAEEISRRTGVPLKTAQALLEELRKP